jgi:oxygen-independent coproporphyrinogen-3 oxidase
MHLYLHVPFCRQACYYCDFHFSTNLAGRAELVAAMAAELRLQRGYLGGTPLQTIYFGGGTPSLLSVGELGTLLDVIHAEYPVAAGAEVTLEANPDDLTPAALAAWQALGINRLSVGVQSFDEGHLRYLHRIHTAKEAEAGVKRAQDAGLTNLSVDLIYAVPAPSHAIWEQDLARATALGVPHLSAYCLTIEPRTVFGNWLRDGRIGPIEEEFAAHQFELLNAHLGAAGYEAYEISNFARDGRYSRHNTSYWQRHPYLGIGPAAHSYDGQWRRQYNVAHNARYVNALAAGTLPAELDELTPRDVVNEYLLTGLRTRWGCNLDELGRVSAEGRGRAERLAQDALARGWLRQEGSVLYLTPAGRLLADRVAADLFWV